MKKQVHFTIRCNLSDAPIIASWFEDLIGEGAILEQCHLQREITDSEVPIGFKLAATFEI